MQKKSSKLATLVCIALSSCIPDVKHEYRHYPRAQQKHEQVKKPKQFSLLHPDRIKAGIMYPFGADLSNFDEEVQRTNDLLSNIAFDANLSSPKEGARTGEINVPQIELEYFLTQKEDFSFFLRVGANYDHSDGRERIYTMVPIPGKVDIDIETRAGVVLIAMGLDYYPKGFPKEIKPFVGAGIEAHYVWMDQDWNAKMWGIPVWSSGKDMDSFGATGFARVGAEIQQWDPLRIIPDDVTFSIAAEYHETINSELGEDPDGFRCMLYMIKPIGSRK